MSITRTFVFLFTLLCAIVVIMFLVRNGYAERLFDLASRTKDYSDESSKKSLRRDVDEIRQNITDEAKQEAREEIGDVLGIQTQGFSFDVVADIEPEYSTYEQHLSDINNDGSRFLVVNGDVTPKGFDKEFRLYQSFTDERLDIPFHTVPGNHDILQDGDTSTFASAFGYRYMSFDYANAHFVLLDNASAARGFDDEQLTWLLDDLQKNTKPFVFVFMHRPLDVPFASFVLGKDNELSEENIANFLEILRAHEVDAIFAAHVPGFIEYTLQDLEIPVYASGGGGSPSSVDFLEQDYHYLHVRVSDESFAVEKVDLEQ